MLSEQRAMCFHSWWFCWSSAWPRPSRDPPSDRRRAPSPPPPPPPPPPPKRGALSSAIPTSWWSTKWRWQPTGRERCSRNNIRNGDLPLNGPKSSVSALRAPFAIHFFLSFWGFYECQVRFGLELVATRRNIAHTQTISPCICASHQPLSHSAVWPFFQKYLHWPFGARVCVEFNWMCASIYVIFFFINQIRKFVEYSSLLLNSWAAILYKVDFIQGHLPCTVQQHNIRRSGKLIKRG